MAITPHVNFDGSFEHRVHRQGVCMKGATLDHLHIYCRDPEASIAFYERHFGARRMGGTASARGESLRFLLLGGDTLAVSGFPVGLEPKDPPPARGGAYPCGYGVAHIGLNVPDLDAAVGALEGAGVTILTAPQHARGLSYAYVAGPDGVIIELTEYRFGRLSWALPILKGIYGAGTGIRNVIKRWAVRYL
ncbi:VOC family protein [Myxococcota bacterium]